MRVLSVFFAAFSAAACTAASPSRRVPRRFERGTRRRAEEAAATAATATPPWDGLAAQLDAWPLSGTGGFGVTVGDADGIRFEYTRAPFSAHAAVETASTSKWPMAMMFTGLVRDGTIASLDDHASDYVPWWSSDRTCGNVSACDAKGNITIRHLLSFTSGFDTGEVPGGGGGGSANATKCLMNSKNDYERCAKDIYHNLNLTGPPGNTFAYNSIHLQLMGVVALHATKMKSAQEIFHKYFVVPYGMNETTCGGGDPNPEFAVCLSTTQHDYAKFLHAQLTGSVLGKELVAQSEKNYTPFLKNDTVFTIYGLYAFGHWLECYDSVHGFTDACADAAVHADPGAFGFYPLIDRKNAYYMQIVAYETGDNYPLSGIPEYLRLAAKPLVDAVMRKDDPTINGENVFAHHTPSLNSLSIADVNYIAQCALHPLTCL
jgi:CubicO group peptidase (beta-lactamase class C family)